MERYFLFILLVSLAFWRCSDDGEEVSGQEDSPAVTDTLAVSLSEGKALAEKHCSTCHLLPDPGQLDKATWMEGVLPNMGARLGIRQEGYDPFDGVDPEEIAAQKGLNVYPDEALLEDGDWKAIVDYYRQNAPEELPPQRRTTQVSPDPPPFTPSHIDIEAGQFPQVTLLEFDPGSGNLFIGNDLSLYALNRNGNFQGNWETRSPSSDISFHEQGVFLLSIGQFNPSERKEGVFSPLMLEAGKDPDKYVIGQLPRPVSLVTGDLNEDGNDDLLVCGFGNHQGRLAWYDQFRAEKENVLSYLPGARKAVMEDLNQDGRMDIVVLMAQAWEKISVYYNTGGGKFREETLLEWPAVYGSSYFELADLNGDGHLDILYSNGDNWDYSTVPKPYHGLRIYLNDGSNHFSEVWFYPMYGCSEARTVDFDRDGDLDIAAIAFYQDPDLNPAGSFVYLENEGQLSFSAHYMNEAAVGKWLVMDVGDFDRDGYDDIFLGSYFHNTDELGKLMLAGVGEFPEVLLLTFDK